MSSYSFKSVGKTQAITTDESIDETQIPYGIKTPLRSTSSGLFDMNYDLADQFSDNLRNLILTNWGERPCLYKFGANLRPLLTEFVSLDNFDNAAINSIKNAVETWMPFIDLENYQSSKDTTTNNKLGVINLKITYNIPALSIQKKSLEIILYVILYYAHKSFTKKLSCTRF